jgi:hypothetical protein
MINEARSSTRVSLISAEKPAEPTDSIGVGQVGSGAQDKVNPKESSKSMKQEE